jgi:enterochelin esterase family protein
LQPDIYVYSFIVDGLRITDPNNFSLKYNLITDESLLHVPGDASLLWEVSDVPHGDLHRHYYHSAVSGDYRDYIVYTPPGYNPSAWKKYPVLYLLHGYSDDTTTWSAVGCANVILDNLIARHLAKPMIVVMPLGYGDMNVVKGGWGGLRVRGLLEGSMSKFQEGLLKEIVPQVEKDYRASGDRNNRAIAGVSMGATESLLTGLNRPDQFAWIGSFSAGGLETNYPAEFPAAGTNLNSQLRLFWLSCGDRDSLFPLNRGFNDWLASRGVSAKWVDVSGEHSFRLWRRNLADFTPLLFLKTK